MNCPTKTSMTCILAAALFFSADALAAETLADGVGNVVSDNAQDAFSALESGDDSLPTSDDYEAAKKQADEIKALEEEAAAKKAAEAAGSQASDAAEGQRAEGESEGAASEEAPAQPAETADDSHYLQPPPNLPEAADQSHYLEAPPQQQSASSASQIEPEKAPARTFGGPVRLELGIGWSSGATNTRANDVYSEETLKSSGPAGFLALKFRPSAQVPLHIGIDLSATHQPWVEDRYNHYDNDKLTAFAGNLVFDIYPIREIYVSLGVGACGLDRYWHHGDVDLGVSGVLAAGIELEMSPGFRLGGQLRLQGGIFSRDLLFGGVSGYLVLSFF